MQQRVRKRFSELQEMDERDGQIPWFIVDAAQSIEDVQKDINTIVENTVEKVQSEKKSVGLMWK